MPTFTVANNAEFTKKIELSPEDERHLLRVMRVKVGEVFQVTNGKGEIADVKVTTTNPPVFEVVSVRSGELPLPVTVYLPLIEQTRLEWAVEKLTELNVKEICLTATARTQTQGLKPAKLERLRKTATAAEKQSGRCCPVIIHEPIALGDVSHDVNTLRLVAIPGTDQPSADTLLTIGKAKQIAVFVGPEGGFTTSEVAALLASGAVAVGLGGTVLRAETVTVTMAMIVKMGRL